MAAGWPEMGMDLAMAMGLQFNPSASTANVPCMYGLPNPTTEPPAIIIDDILDFSDHNTSSNNNNNAEAAHIVTPPPEHTPSPVADVPRSFADDLYIPCEEAAELEWLSQFVEDSFSNNPYPPSAAGQPPTPLVTAAGSGHRKADTNAAPRGARSKRSRGSAAHRHQNQLLTAWSAPAAAAHSTSSSTTTSSSSSSDFSSSKARGGGGGNRRRGGDGGGGEGGVRRCTHCASEKTPQWRTGPLGPKTLCNACGVRYKSGRLVPEYRPAASPTFVLAHHSNSHRKVMELRRQKELVVIHHPPSAGEEMMLFHDYEVC